MNRAAILLLLSGLATAPVCAQPAQPKTDTQLETVIVTAPRLSDEVKAKIQSFVMSFAAASSFSDELARWNQPICPMTYGFARPQDNVFVTRRIRQIAAEVGAPTLPAPCKPNTEIFFASDPQELLDTIRQHGGSVLLTSRPSRAKQAAVFAHPIQAWYATATRDICGMVRFDNEDDKWWDGSVSPGTCQPRNSNNYATEGSLLRTGLKSELAHIYIVADVSKTAGHPFQAVADYVAMLALSQTNAFEACAPLPSIANLMSENCTDAEKASEMTQTDLAFLRGIYSMDPGASVITQRAAINFQIESVTGDR